MQQINGKKALLLCILEILKKYSDADHPITSRGFIKHLEEDYGMVAERKVVIRNIALLMELGYDINPYEENGRGYFLHKRVFEDEELIMLMDALLCSKYILQADAEGMIDRLSAMTTVYFPGHMRDIKVLPQSHQARSKNLLSNLMRVGEAIAGQRKFSFINNQYDVDGKLHPFWDAPRTVSPYQLVCVNRQYYLIANHGRYESLVHYRLDKMTDIRILEEAARPVSTIPGNSNGLDLYRYAAGNGFLLAGKSDHVILKMNRFCAGDVVDAFGAEAKMIPIDKDYMEVHVRTPISGMRRFVLQQGKNCEVIAPVEFKEALRDEIREMNRRLI